MNVHISDPLLRPLPKSARCNVRAIVLLLDADVTLTERRIELLSAVLLEHPDARIETCRDELTGTRFGEAQCRAGRAKKVGYVSYQYQVWAVWS